MKLVTLVLASLLVASASGQSRLVVETNVPNAIVYADSLRLGPAGTSLFILPEGAHQIRLVPEQLDGWTVLPLTYEVPAEHSDTVHARLFFPYHYRIESVPYGAEVYLDTPSGSSTLLGDTPLVYRSETIPAGSFRIVKTGFQRQLITPGQEVWNRHVVALDPEKTQGDEARPLALLPRSGHRSWIDYVAIGTAVGAGVLSIHYKFKADALYDRYRETGDRSLVRQVRQYDHRAAYSLGAMQVGVGVFAIRLLIR